MPEATIVGAGPSGLTCAILLVQAGWTVRVVEHRLTVGEHSRAIGIHPPGLAVLDRVGVASGALDQGVRISQGIGISRDRTIGQVDFGQLAVRHNYILSLPQNQTIQLLRQRLNELAPRALELGTKYLHHRQAAASSRIQVTSQKAGPTQSRDTDWLIAADGTDSTVRQQLGLDFHGRSLSDRYLMGDYPQSTDFGATAALFLHPRGIVESFPLPQGRRRWVAHAGRGSGPAPELEQLVAERTGHQLPSERSMYSEFRTAHRQVASMVHGRVILIGDAAHEISPIGGQGMTLGLLDAQELAHLLTGELPVTSRGLAEFSTRRLARARRAARQAQVNMFLGRPLPSPLVPLRDGIFSVLNRQPRFMHALARTFSMCDEHTP
ncbi:FAD-dependent oxidoreductase [Glutamicibacter uratoxydans]|uniref:FAD-dependent oxidoreductase n=1 Tax=Glutamicibacter uratoxydans TaxID=43667 RepID=UPI003D6E38CD